ncbi:hypothetical protein KP509_07G080600 [Ceratopteris richardii]|uniref:Uncharacterized protein n=1 Tax=Ceratopteris richardii TaxID=49495 RepID=A0A8T2UJZ4_CERRI|nr:hypothetical protein KP509_07G080600 [Ceratopteris richardii]KAH7433674.1 hypothetical protein KP509_07G080600 [Ceratopteris richardii]KAH7433675.1 hypothetical protein KP509_07G080600 [Ceratopteris richardii]KAH7433676.1 hypothetical protein KP509_07G080600 [Ceratopteris richardii]
MPTFCDRSIPQEMDPFHALKRIHRLRPGFYLAFFVVLLLSPSTHVVGFKHIKQREVQGPIKTIVVLVMENRSFDHMLGWLKRLNPEIDGVTGHEWNPLNVHDPNSERVFFRDDSEFVDPDPGHSFQAIREQIFGGADTSAYPAPMNGFAQQAESMEPGFSRTVMSGFRPEIVSSYTSLAMEYAICDRWFASVPSSTQPNRFYVHSATSHGEMSNVRRDLVQGFPQKTIFDSIEESGLTYGIYYQNIPATLFFQSMRRIKSVRNFHKFELSFKRHAREGKLPNYVVLEQRYFDVQTAPANDDHPSHDVYQGQMLVKSVYETLRSSPQWNEMLFIITYDEHGGFYDHVPTPLRNVPNPDGMDGHIDYFSFGFDRLGVRVPTIFVSPWINKGTVLHGPNGPTESSQFEHSSLPATLKKIFNLTSDFLTSRDAWAGTFESILAERQTPRTDCPETLPSPMWPLRSSPPNENRMLSEFQEELVMLAYQLIGKSSLFENNVSMTVGEANTFVEDAVASFLEAGRIQLRSGVDEMSLVDVKLAAMLNKQACTGSICQRSRGHRGDGSIL